MGYGGAAVSTCVEFAPLSSLKARAVLCYPPHVGGCDATRRASELSSAGVEGLCIYGPTSLDFVVPGLRVLGKGHSSVVVAAITSEGLTALKIKRSDSRRTSLAEEAWRLERASRAGASPSVVTYSDNFILMDYLGVITLGKLIELSGLGPQTVLEALRAARQLDLANILHAELHRPQGNVIYPYWPQSPRALIVDLESATDGCGNVSKVTSFLWRQLNLPLSELREVLTGYRRSCSRESYLEVENAFLKFMSAKAKPQPRPPLG